YNLGMKSVGVDNLKSQLNDYLRMVKEGETILVTEEDSVIAELRPTSPQNGKNNSLEGILRALATRGEVTVRAKEPVKWPTRPLTRISGLSSSQDMLDDIRGDRT